MTESTSPETAATETPAPAATPAPAPTGVKAKVTELGTKAYLAAPPKAQTAILNGVLKAQPVLAKVKPHRAKVLAGGAALVALRRLRRRKG